MTAPEPQNREILIALFVELSAAMRERSQAEYLYVAAAIAAYGAVCWGVAALNPATYHGKFWMHPAIVAAIGVLVTAVLIMLRVCRQHGKYAKIKKERSEVAGLLRSIMGETGNIPRCLSDEEGSFLDEKGGKGALFSNLVLLGFAVTSIAFCLVART